MSIKHINIIAAVFLLIFAGFLTALSFDITTGASLSIGSEFMPRVISISLMVCSLILIFEEFFKAKKNKLNNEKQRDIIVKIDYKSLLMSFIALFGYMWIFVRVGYIISTIAYLFLQIGIFTPKEKRNLLKIGLISAVIAVMVYGVFVHGFKLMLPSGIFG